MHRSGNSPEIMSGDKLCVLSKKIQGEKNLWHLNLKYKLLCTVVQLHQIVNRQKPVQLHFSCFAFVSVILFSSHCIPTKTTWGTSAEG